MELVYLAIALIVIVMFVYREFTRKKREREYFSNDKDVTKNKK